MTAGYPKLHGVIERDEKGGVARFIRAGASLQTKTVFIWILAVRRVTDERKRWREKIGENEGDR